MGSSGTTALQSLIRSGCTCIAAPATVVTAAASGCGPQLILVAFSAAMPLPGAAPPPAGLPVKLGGSALGLSPYSSRNVCFCSARYYRRDASCASQAGRPIRGEFKCVPKRLHIADCPEPSPLDEGLTILAGRRGVNLGIGSSGQQSHVAEVMAQGEGHLALRFA